MTRIDQQRQYANFFKSGAGIALIARINLIIADNYEKAEEDLDHAGSYLVAVRALKDVKDHIERNSNPAVKGAPK